MNYLYIFSVLLTGFIITKTVQIDRNYRNDITLMLDDDFPYIGALQKSHQDKFEFLCTLVLIRPLWLLGSIINCNLDDILKDTDDLSINDMIVTLHKTNKKIKKIIYPEDDDNDIIIIQLEYNPREPYKILPALELGVYDNKITKCFSVDFYNEDTNLLIFKYNRIENSTEKCERVFSGRRNLRNLEQFLCSETLNKSNSKYNGPMFCKIDNKTVDVFGLKMAEDNVTNLWTKLAYYRLYIQKNVDKLINQMFDFPNMAYLINELKTDVEYPCTLIFIRANWLIGSISQCNLNYMYGSPLKYSSGLNSFHVVIILNDTAISTPVLAIKFHDDYMQNPKENDIVLIKTKSFETIPPFDIDIGECFTKYTSCHYIFWIYNNSHWGLCTTQATIDYENFCPTENLNLILKSNTACTKNISVNQLSNTFILLCDKLDENYELIGMKIFDYTPVQQEHWLSFMKQKQMIQQRIDINEHITPKMESVAILENKNKYCTIAFLTSNPVLQELWYIGTLVYCDLQNIIDDMIQKKDVNLRNYTVITPFEQKLEVSEIIFDNYMNIDSTLFLIKCRMPDDPYDPKAYQLIPDKQPDNQCFRLYGKYDFINKKYVFNSEEINLIFDKRKCKYRDGTDNWYCSEGKAETAGDGVLLCKLSSIYHLIGLRTDYRTKHKKFRKWIILSSYKSWIGYVINAEFDGIVKSKYKSLDKKEERRFINQFHFGKDIEMPPYMVKILDKSSSPCVCYGYILLRNLVITGSQCGLLSNKTLTESFIPAESVSSVLIETKSKDISIVQYIIYPEYNSSFSLDEVALLLLRWPLIPSAGFVEFTKIFMQESLGLPLNMICNIITPTHPNVFKAFGYTGASTLTQIKIPIVNTQNCIDYYKNQYYVQWKYVICTNTKENDSIILFTDYSTGLFCNNYLVAIAAEVYNNPLSSISMKQEGVHVPIGWIRLDMFQNLIKIFYEQDWTYLQNVSYGNQSHWPRWKFMCSIQYKKNHLSSCVLISDHFVLTSSDVITAYQYLRDQDELTVVFGNYDLKNPGVDEEIHRIFSILRVNNSTNLLLIRLITKVSETIPRLHIIQDFIIISVMKCRSAGWPRNSITRWYHYDKFEVSQTLRSIQYTIKYVLDQFIYTNNSEDCLADIGMPLVCDNQLVGISAWDEKCDESELIKRWTNVGQLKSEIETAITELNMIYSPNTKLKPNFLAAIFINDEYRCVGTLVSEKWILTSAYCFMNISLSNVKIIIGLKDIDEVQTGQVFTLKKYSLPYTDCNDVALAELSQPVNLSDKFYLTDTISVHSARDCAIFGSYVNLSLGWPDKSRNQKRDIQIYELHPHADRFCSFPNHTITDHHVCTYIHKEDAPFLKYPGSPLLCVPKHGTYKIQYGINAWGMGATSNDKTTIVWASIETYSTWIFSKTVEIPELSEMELRHLKTLQSINATYNLSNISTILYNTHCAMVYYVFIFVMYYYYY